MLHDVEVISSRALGKCERHNRYSSRQMAPSGNQTLKMNHILL